jgi:hypothetical protein
MSHRSVSCLLHLSSTFYRYTQILSAPELILAKLDQSTNPDKSKTVRHLVTDSWIKCFLGCGSALEIA